MKFLEFLNESTDEKKFAVDFDFAFDDMLDEIDENPSKKNDIIHKYIKKSVGKLKIKYVLHGFASNGCPEIEFIGTKDNLIKLITKLHGDGKDDAEEYFNDYAEEI